MLDEGQFCSQEIIDNAPRYERDTIADDIWYLHQDLAKGVEFFLPESTFKGWYPESKARLSENLSSESFLADIRNGLTEFVERYKADRDILRFHYHDPEKLLVEISDLMGNHKSFKAQKNFNVDMKLFFTEDEKDHLLINKGSGTEGGKYRINDFFKADHTEKEKIDFLKNEYGTGGSSSPRGYDEWHDSKGICYKKGGISLPECEYMMKWNEASKRISRLVSENRYLTEEDIAGYDKYLEHRKEYLASFVPVNKPDFRPTFEIYQIREGSAYRDYRWANLDQLEKFGLNVDKDNYRMVYSGDLSAIENPNKLEGIFEKYNVGERPEDYDGTLPSVSDVIVLNLENGSSAHYIDRAGFIDVSDKFIEAERRFSADKNVKEDTPEKAAEIEDKPKKLADNEPITLNKVGDFYELYGRDARNAAEVLGLHLTKKNGDDMCGFPAHEKDSYSAKLAEAGYAVLIAVTYELDPPKREKEIPEQEKNEEKRKSADEIEVGDRFLYKGKEYKVTSMQGVYPDDVAVSYMQKDTLHMTEYEVTSNFDKYVLAEQDYLGNDLKKERDYEPKIGDVVEWLGENYKISDITSETITLMQEGTFIPETLTVPLDSFLGGEYSVIEEVEAVYSEEAVDDTVHNDIESNSDNRETSHNFRITDEHFGEAGGDKSRYKNNIEAIKTLKAIESENRTATPEEQEILAGYTGWGAIPQAFDSINDKWKDEYTELKELLTDEEYSAARQSTLNAHFTSPIVINAIYDGLRQMGFTEGKVLEPSAGIGNFIGASPKDMKLKFTGVEIDSLTGRIAKQLYPESDINIMGFEKTDFADGSFDAAVSNVPFGDYKVNDPRYNDRNLLIHDYFFEKALDKVHAGGIVAFVTSKGTMDKADEEVRKYLAQNAELLGAVRLPNTAFRANAGTEVTADILFLQKRERPIEIEPDNVEWLKKVPNADGMEINNYFVQHPEMVLGRIVEDNKLYGAKTNDTMCVPIEGADLKQQLVQAISNIKGEYRKPDREKTVSEQDEEIPAPPDSRKFSFYEVDGKIYYREDGSMMKPAEMNKKAAERLLGMIKLRENVHELLNHQLNNSDGSLDGFIAESRASLNKQYDEFVSKYGYVNDKANARAMKGDNGYNIVAALEVIDENGNVSGKADIFTKNTVKPKIVVSHVDTAEEALILSVSEKAQIDFDYMTELCGMDKDTLISELDGQIFRLPKHEEEYVTSDEYLTGNIRKKLKALDMAPEGMDVSKNRAALEAAMPPKISAKDISAKLGSHWIAPDYIRQFIVEKFKPDWNTKEDMRVEYSKVAGTWKIDDVSKASKNSYNARSVYGTDRKHAYEIIEGILNNSDLRVKDRLVKDGVEVRDAKGNYVLIVNEEESKAVRHCANVIKSEFKDWIFADPERRADLENTYNELFNSIRQREYDGSHLNFVGMNTDIELKEHQKNAVARALYGGNTLLAHEVGLGKTFEMIAIAMEGKRLGLHNKSLFAVPNSLTEQIGADFRKLYPNSNVLVATKKDFEKKNRLKLLRLNKKPCKCQK